MKFLKNLIGRVLGRRLNKKKQDSSIYPMF
jgi:hypothetical protein